MSTSLSSCSIILPEPDRWSIVSVHRDDVNIGLVAIAPASIVRSAVDEASWLRQ
jgi:hypothetical protein